MGPACETPPITVLPWLGSQSSSTHTQQPLPPPPPDPPELDTAVAPPEPTLVVAVVSAERLPVMFFQLWLRLSQCGLNFHSWPVHCRPHSTGPASLARTMSLACKTAYPLGVVI